MVTMSSIEPTMVISVSVNYSAVINFRRVAAIWAMSDICSQRKRDHLLRSSRNPTDSAIKKSGLQTESEEELSDSPYYEHIHFI